MHCYLIRLSISCFFVSVRVMFPVQLQTGRLIFTRLINCFLGIDAILVEGTARWVVSVKYLVGQSFGILDYANLFLASSFDLIFLMLYLNHPVLHKHLKQTHNMISI